MKTAFFTFVYTLSISLGFAQSAVIIDPASFQLSQVSSNPGCNTADQGKLIYNSVQNRVFMCNGTSWMVLNTVFPYIGTSVGSTNSFVITNNGTGKAIRTFAFEDNGSVGVTQAGSGFAGVSGLATGSGSIGILGSATAKTNIGLEATNTAGGIALSVNGKVKIAGGANGYLLMIDQTDGNALWKNAYESSAGKKSFSVNNITNPILTDNVWSKIYFENVEFNEGQNFEKSSGYTVPLSGFYQFDAQISWYGATYTPFNHLSSGIRLMLKRGNNIPVEIVTSLFPKETKYSASNSVSVAYRVLQGDLIWVEAYRDTDDGSDAVIEVHNEANNFSGRLIFVD